MNTFTRLYLDVFTPEEAATRITGEIGKSYKENLANLEERAVNFVGKTIYQKLVKGYTEKQWAGIAQSFPPL